MRRLAPKYDHSVIKDNGYLVIYGAYDAVHTVIDPVTGVHQLAVEFVGRCLSWELIQN